MSELNMTSKLLAKVARGWHVAAGKRTLAENTAQEFSDEYLSGENNPGDISSVIPFSSERPFRAAEDHDDKISTVDDGGTGAKETTKDKRGVDSPDRQIVQSEEGLPSFNSSGQKSNLSQIKKVDDFRIIENPQTEKELPDDFSPRANTSEHLPVDVLKSDGDERAEKTVQQKEVSPERKASGRLFYRMDAHDFQRNNAVGLTTVVGQKPSTAEGAPEAMMDIPRKGSSRKQTDIHTDFLSEKPGAGKPVAAEEKALPQIETMATARKIANHPALPDMEIKKEPLPSPISQFVDNRSAKIRDYIPAAMTQAKQTAGNIMPPRPANLHESQNRTVKKGSVHIGSINIQVKEKERDAGESWPEPPRYTNHIITEDWNWSCQYGK